MLIELRRVGGTVSPETTDALREATAALSGEAADGVSLTASSQDDSVVVLDATVRESSPIAAMGWIDTLLDRSLLATGLFEDFDVTGKVIRVAPFEIAEGI